MKYSNENVIINVKRLLKEKDETQADLAECLTINPTAVSEKLSLKQTTKDGKEKKRQTFTVKQLFRIAEHFNISLDELCSDRNDIRISTNVRTVSDLLSILFDLEDRISICTVKKWNDFGKEYDIPCVCIENGLVQLALMQWDDFQSIPMDDKKKNRIINSWKSVTLSENEKNPIRSYTDKDGKEVIAEYNYYDLVKDPNNLLESY